MSALPPKADIDERDYLRGWKGSQTNDLNFRDQRLLDSTLQPSVFVEGCADTCMKQENGTKGRRVHRSWTVAPPLTYPALVYEALPSSEPSPMAEAGGGAGP
jgi:hypothetical protein